MKFIQTTRKPDKKLMSKLGMAELLHCCEMQLTFLVIIRRNVNVDFVSEKKS